MAVAAVLGACTGSSDPFAGLSPGDVAWARQIGNGLEQDATLSPAPGGGVYLGGQLHGRFDVGGGEIGIEEETTHLLARFAANGGVIWSRVFDSLAFWAPTLLPAGEQVYAVGGLSLPAGAIYIASITSEGELQWKRDIGSGPVDYVDAALHRGAFFLAGTSWSMTDLGGGSVLLNEGGIALGAFDADGDHAWSLGIAGDGLTIAPYRIGVLDSDAILLAGSLGSLYRDFGGATIDDPYAKMFVARYDAASGALIGVDGYGESGSVAVNALVPTPGGGYILAGTLTSRLDFGDVAFAAPLSGSLGFVVEYDGGGALSAAWEVGIDLHTSIEALAVDDAGNAVVAGRTSGTTSRDDVLFVRKYDAARDLVWARSFPAYRLNAQLKVDDVVVTEAGVFVAGAFSELDLDGDVLQTQDFSDLFLIALAP